ncbi:hypothetical protein HDV06_006563 [Boothiomyces sp. JEL0866]|nr:hypothetical protein HDV06_006563 [Boothiomyces sp. JEL0866]
MSVKTTELLIQETFLNTWKELNTEKNSFVKINTTDQDLLRSALGNVRAKIFNKLKLPYSKILPKQLEHPHEFLNISITKRTKRTISRKSNTIKAKLPEINNSYKETKKQKNNKKNISFKFSNIEINNSNILKFINKYEYNNIDYYTYNEDEDENLIGIEDENKFYFAEEIKMCDKLIRKKFKEISKKINTTIPTEIFNSLKENDIMIVHNNKIDNEDLKEEENKENINEENIEKEEEENEKKENDENEKKENGENLIVDNSDDGNDEELKFEEEEEIMSIDNNEEDSEIKPEKIFEKLNINDIKEDSDSDSSDED